MDASEFVTTEMVTPGPGTFDMHASVFQTFDTVGSGHETVLTRIDCLLLSF